MKMIEQRRKHVVNTDLQRRCYNGCHYSSETRWSEWETLEWDVKPERVAKRLQFWRELNEYAVSQRGKGAEAEFREVNEP